MIYLVDSAIQLLNNLGQVNQYPVDKYYKNQLRYPPSKDKYPMDSVIHLSRNSGAPNANFWKISVRKTIWDLEFSEHLL